MRKKTQKKKQEKNRQKNQRKVPLHRRTFRKPSGSGELEMCVKTQKKKQEKNRQKNLLIVGHFVNHQDLEN